MVALDQNSSMIEMAAKALKGKGQDREPTYEEIVEAKVDLARHLAPAGSGVLDRRLLRGLVGSPRGPSARRRACWCGSRSRAARRTRSAAPMGEIEPGWSVEKIKLMGADAVKLLAQFEPSEPISAEHQFAADHARLRRMQEARYPAAAGNSRVPVRRREEDRRQLPEPQGRDGHRVGPPAQPVLRHLQGGVSRHPGPRFRQPASRQPRRRLNAASERPWVLAIGGRRLPRLLQAGGDGHERRLPRAYWAAGRSGRSISSRTAPRLAASSPQPRPSSEWPT